jgi:hypothetical protein
MIQTLTARPGDKIPSNLKTPNVRAAFRAALAFLIASGDDALAGELRPIDPTIHCVIGRAGLAGASVEIAPIVSILPTMPPAVLAEIEAHAGQLLFLVQDLAAAPGGWQTAYASPDALPAEG